MVGCFFLFFWAPRFCSFFFVFSSLSTWSQGCFCSKLGPVDPVSFPMIVPPTKSKQAGNAKLPLFPWCFAHFLCLAILRKAELAVQAPGVLGAACWQRFSRLSITLVQGRLRETNREPTHFGSCHLFSGDPPSLLFGRQGGDAERGDHLSGRQPGSRGPQNRFTTVPTRIRCRSLHFLIIFIYLSIFCLTFNHIGSTILIP